jgi:Spy/CpxP family protein refolding chaperone
MKKNQWFAAVSLASLLCAGATQALAQDNPGPPRGGRNFDPAQFQQRRLERIKEQMEITDDTEWKALEPLIQKVMDARMASFAGMGGRGMFGGGRRGGDNAQGDQGGGQRRGGMFGAPSPEAEALQKAIDAKAPKAEIKAALTKYIESRKAKQAELEKAQDDLRKVLTARQEAIATLDGLL